MTGIYYLWDGARVLYIGQSRNVAQRVQKHTRGDMDFCGYFCDPCKPHKLNELEAKAIAEFNPLFNCNATL